MARRRAQEPRVIAASYTTLTTPTLKVAMIPSPLLVRVTPTTRTSKNLYPSLTYLRGMCLGGPLASTVKQGNILGVRGIRENLRVMEDSSISERISRSPDGCHCIKEKWD